MLDEIVDFFSDAWDYIIGFEFLEDIGDFFANAFDDIGEISYLGLAFAIAVIIFVYALRDYMLNPFLVHMSLPTATFWGITTYVGCGVLGYLIGKGLFGDE